MTINGRKVMYRRRALLLALAASVLPQAAGSATAAEKAAILLPGSINDQSWNANGYQGAEQLKAKGWEVAYSENVAPADMAEAMRDYAGRGYTLVIGHTGRFLSAAQQIGPDYPKTTFVVGSGSAGAGTNVTSVDYDNAQFGYLMGVLAAKMSKTGKVGSVNGLEGLPNVVAQVGGFRKGVKSVDPNIEVKVVYIQNMEDAAEAKEAALSLIAGGADFIFGKLNAGQAGIIQAAKEKGVMASGRSLGHSAIAPEAVATNIIEKWGDMYGSAGDAAKAGTLGGKFQVYGLGTPGSTGADFAYQDGKPFNPKVPAEAVAALDAARAKLAAGEIKVEVTKADARGGV
ncbi:BMP family ABC transporter substrate-binding protein [Methylobacterium terricola]|uniref:BMP family ABC transporter substrate-binding protein n=2 Tax=Methylobacterium terricola TaxID=2583531 RepID=A0A5C4L6A5_9HYPH|nr:BMP family ABC transporter substrate-binding protein [Methylobacterium terricola]